MGQLFLSMTVAALLAGAAVLPARVVWAGSCCGGGSPTSLIVPKYARAVADLCFDMELYNGYWDQAGNHKSDPPGSDLKQYRLNLGYGQRFFGDWQASIVLPYVWNVNRYSGLSSETDGLGDTTVALWYDAIDERSPWRVRQLEDMVPAVTIGLSLLLPTGISPYDDVKSSFDVTGRGFYRLDGNLLIDKTIHPWNASIALSYGTYFERAVNREYGKYVEPYTKQLGDRFSITTSVGYRYVLGAGGDSLTGTVSHAYLQEDSGSVNGRGDDLTAFSKQSLGCALMYGSTDDDWSARVSWNHAISGNGWGSNFPTTDIITVGVRYVFR